MTKQELELQVKELNAALTQFELDRVSIAGKLDKAKSDLQDVNKVKQFLTQVIRRTQPANLGAPGLLLNPVVATQVAPSLLGAITAPSLSNQ